MNKASAIAFVIVLLFVAVAGYSVYHNIQADLQRSPPPPPTATEEATATLVAALPATASAEPPSGSAQPPTGTPLPATASAQPPVETEPPPPTASFTPSAPPPTETPIPATATDTALPIIRVETATPSAQPPSGTGTPPRATPTPSGATPEATSTFGSPEPRSRPSPTPTVAGKYTYYLDGDIVHDLEAGCMGEYVRGTVRDRKGNLLEGVQIKAHDLWGNEATAASKGGPDLGQWNIVLGPTENVWNVVVLDEGGNPISPVAVVPHHKEGDFKLACTHIVNWRRAW